MTASYHSSSSSLSGAPPPFVHPSVIQPGVFGGGHGWDPSRRTVSGSAFAPESERQRALHAEVKDEDRWDERQPVSPAMSQGSEGEPEMEQGLQHPQVQAQVGMLYRNGIIYTDDADTKQTAEIKRKCYNCESINPPSWRKSTVQPGKIACNKCGIYERTHRRARPRQDDDQKFRRPTPVLTPIVHRHPPTEGLQVMDPSPDNSPVQSPYSTVPSQTPGSSTSASFPPQPSPFSLSGRRGSQGSLMSGHLGTPLSGATGTPVLTPSATPLYGTPLNSSDIMGYYALHHPSASAYANASPLASAAAHGRPSPYHQAYANRRAMTYPYHPLASLSSPVSASTSHSHSHTGATPTVNALSLSQSQSSNATAASLGGNPHSHSLPNGNYLGSSTSTSASISTSTSTGMPHSASASGESEISGSVKASVFGRRYSDADANREVKPDVDMSPNADAQPSEAVQQ
ncbi:hypothetical protein EHS25_007072 [Saitozyma podzolica]|uniref:GATA-type domain-containing protein n=1 Tax=Saitozyma podzolica TaxID=1890683 RepID=A0A427XPH4_9TREE|nr:hypothetical protein EHS25_007072 [Saitozyma podzolica]